MELLSPQPGDVVVDATFGGGGHARLLAESIGADGVLIGIDADSGNIASGANMSAAFSCRRDLICGNFRDLDALLDERGYGRVDVILADLGISSTQLDDPTRGFSFRHDGPLDMRLDDRDGPTAADLVNRMRERELSDLIYYNSQERFSRKIAKAICAARRDRRITTTGRLAEVVCGAMGVDPHSRKSKIHPATRVFQALRIAVNDELGALEAFVAKAPDRLNPGGRIGVIAFHSLEDRVVKTEFRRRKQAGTLELLTKTPITAGGAERQENPRSRSAKLRAARRSGGPD